MIMVGCQQYLTSTIHSHINPKQQFSIFFLHLRRLQLQWLYFCHSLVMLINQCLVGAKKGMSRKIIY